MTILNLTKIEGNYPYGKKTLWEQENSSLQAISRIPSVFKIQQTHEKQGLFGKGFI